MYLTRIAGIEPTHPVNILVCVVMYLTRIAGIEPSQQPDGTTKTTWMYLTRIAGIEPLELSS